MGKAGVRSIVTRVWNCLYFGRVSRPRPDRESQRDYRLTARARAMQIEPRTQFLIETAGFLPGIIKYSDQVSCLVVITTACTLASSRRYQG